MTDSEYHDHDRAVWQRIFAEMPPDWYDAPPSDAMRQCGAYFARRRCARLLDVGCGFGRWSEYLLRQGATAEVIGFDYAENGVRAATAWAQRVPFNARFFVASAVVPPLRVGSFDGLLVALLLDNLDRADCARVMRGLTPLMRSGASGFFVFNPFFDDTDAAEAADDNPTKDCMRVNYEDGELAACLPGWTIERQGETAERFRVIEATLAPRTSAHAGAGKGGFST